MASTGKAAWERHFKGKGAIKTSVKEDSPLYDDAGKRIGNITRGTPIVTLSVDEYAALYPIRYNNKIYKISFGKMNKPLGGRVSGVKLKPQDFETFKSKQDWKSKDLVRSLCEEISEKRIDLEIGLRDYLIDLTKYWGGERVTFRKDYVFDKGINEIKKDYGEILGALACCNKDILNKNIKPATAIMSFPIRGNEPLADYYVKYLNQKYTVSAKSGTTTNTLKPQDVLALLERKKKMPNWNRKGVTKLMRLVVGNTVVQFPFKAINFITGKETLSASALEEAETFKLATFPTKKYTKSKFNDLIKLIKVPGSKHPTIGELFYYTEKYIIQEANKKYNPSEIFQAAISDEIIYVKYNIAATAKKGVFEILESDASKDVVEKKIKWRSGNSRNRASDKIGLQP